MPAYVLLSTDNQPSGKYKRDSLIRAFNKSGYEIKEFEKATKEFMRLCPIESTMMLLSPLILLLTNILILIILFWAAAGRKQERSNLEF